MAGIWNISLNNGLQTCGTICNKLNKTPAVTPDDFVHMQAEGKGTDTHLTAIS